MQEILRIYISIKHEGRTAVVGADQIEVKAAFFAQYILFAVVIVFLVFGAIVEINAQRILAVCLDPPLPGREDILDDNVGPFRVAGKLAVYHIFQAVAGIEVGDKAVPVDDGTFRDIGRHAVKILVLTGTHAYLLILRISGAVGRAAGLAGILEWARPPAAFPFKGHPLELILFTTHSNVVVGTVVKILVQAVVYKLGTQGRDGVHRLTVFAQIITQVIILAPTVSSRFDSCIDDVQRIQSERGRKIRGIRQFRVIPPII